MEPEVAEVIRRTRSAVLDDSDSPDRWGAFGTVLLAHELHSEAAVAYGAAGALAEEDYRFPYLRARSLWRLDPEAAESSAVAAIGLNPDYAPAYLLAGQIAEDGADPETARAHYQGALDRLGGTRAAPANTAAASFRLGRLLAGDGNLEEALPLLEQAEALAPESGAVAAALARVYRRTGDGERARAAAERARALDHDLLISDPLIDTVNQVAVSVIGKERRAFAAEGAGRPEVAERLLREMIRSRPDAADLYYNLGNNLSRQGKNEEALAAWSTALEKNPDHVSALINSSIVLAQMENLDEAERRCLTRARGPAESSGRALQPRQHHSPRRQAVGGASLVPEGPRTGTGASGDSRLDRPGAGGQPSIWRGDPAFPDRGRQGAVPGGLPAGTGSDARLHG